MVDGVVFKKNIMFIIFSQQIWSSRFLLVNGQKNNFKW